MPRRSGSAGAPGEQSPGATRPGTPAKSSFSRSSQVRSETGLWHHPFVYPIVEANSTRCAQRRDLTELESKTKKLSMVCPRTVTPPFRLHGNGWRTIHPVGSAKDTRLRVR